ncbi:hypothetical protein RGU72_05165 [Undibacterium sp. 5I1]|uniref:hypothetical protein n=1 Tax=unclassified Undibacterium TaxID=2630295 RepID=UPI002AB56081|nr:MULTISPECIES: hypothetical protein [unclassified Undibacterium]MDY7537644.1 hypothetical protein [Undibacterium sp. 5I1]MEB0230189.1 hypothetical protein [Undibacterium sp. 10I3]MEB0256381.1 hypothetical protein [Undibacterium sp. 5I1]
MPMLKDVGNLSSVVGVSPISKSPIWHQSVEKITVVQLHAFIRRMKDLGLRDEAETAVEIVLRETKKAVISNQIAPPPYLDFQLKRTIQLTIGELRRGLTHAGQPYASAIMFALELGLTSKQVASLTWKQFQQLEKENTLTPLAREAFKAAVRNIATPYLYWVENDSKPVGLFSLDAVVFDSFGLVWGELEAGYANLIMIDGEANLQSMDCFLRR